MRIIELARKAVREKSPKGFDEKMDEFVSALLQTEEGRRLRRIVQPRIAKGIGMREPLG